MKKYEVLEKKEFTKIPDHGNFKNYLQFVKKENSNFEIVDDKYINYLSEFDVGGGGGNSESTSFSIGSLEKTIGSSSKLDYSKRSIKEFLKKEFDLTGHDLDNKVDYLYNYLTVKHELTNKEVSTVDGLVQFTVKGKKIYNKPPALKGFNNSFKLTRSGKVIKQINFIIWLHNGYKLSNVNLDDLKQDLILYYLQRQTLLLKHYRQAVKRFKKKYEVNYRFSYSTFIFKVLKKEFRKKVNSYLYTVNIPFEIEKKFIKKSFTKQKRSMSINKVLIDVDGQKVEYLPDLPSIKSCYIRKQASKDIIGGQLYFDLSNKYNDNQKSNLSIDQLLNKNKLSFKGIESEVFSLRVDGFNNNQIINLLEIKKDKLRNAIRSINLQLASEQLPALARIRK